MRTIPFPCNKLLPSQVCRNLIFIIIFINANILKHKKRELSLFLFQFSVFLFVLSASFLVSITFSMLEHISSHLTPLSLSLCLSFRNTSIFYLPASLPLSYSTIYFFKSSNSSSDTTCSIRHPSRSASSLLPPNFMIAADNT